MLSRKKNLVIVGTSLFAFLLVCMGIGMYLQNKSRYEKYLPWETESVLSTIGEKTSYDLLLMGSSHGRLFSRNRNHLLVEEAFGKKAATIAGGSSCVIPAKVFLDIFYAKQNTANTILYFIDPWCFYSDKYNNGYVFEHEPFDVQLLIAMIKYRVDPKITKDYLSRTLRQGQKPYVDKSVQPRTEQLESIDASVIQRRLLDLYENDTTRESNPEYRQALLDSVENAKKHDTAIIFIIPPTLYRDPHHDDLVTLLKKNDLTYIDMSQTVTNPAYFYDHDHLNIEGVKMFLELLKREIEIRDINLF